MLLCVFQFVRVIRFETIELVYFLLGAVVDVDLIGWSLVVEKCARCMLYFCVLDYV